MTSTAQLLLVQTDSRRGSESFTWESAAQGQTESRCGSGIHRVLRVHLSDAEADVNHKAGRVVRAFPSVDETVERMVANPGRAIVPLPRVDYT